jgi:hypothetical protein
VDERLKVLTKACPGPDHEGDRVAELEVTAEEVQAYRNGAFIQDAFRSLSADDRERLLTGYCTPCWDKLFPAEERD